MLRCLAQAKMLGLLCCRSQFALIFPHFVNLLLLFEFCQKLLAHPCKSLPHTDALISGLEEVMLEYLPVILRTPTFQSPNIWDSSMYVLEEARVSSAEVQACDPTYCLASST